MYKCRWERTEQLLDYGMASKLHCDLTRSEFCKNQTVALAYSAGVFE